MCCYCYLQDKKSRLFETKICWQFCRHRYRWCNVLAKLLPETIPKFIQMNPKFIRIFWVIRHITWSWFFIVLKICRFLLQFCWTKPVAFIKLLPCSSLLSTKRIANNHAFFLRVFVVNIIEKNMEIVVNVTKLWGKTLCENSWDATS